MHLGAAQGFCADLLTGGGLDQGRARQKEGGLFPDHDGLVRHGGHVGTPAVQSPITTASWGMLWADMRAWL